MRKSREQDKEATVYIGNIDERVTDSLVWELMLQAGRIVNVHLPKDRVTQTHQGYGFVEFISEEDAEYAARIMNQVRLYGKPIRVNKVCLLAYIYPPIVQILLLFNFTSFHLFRFSISQ